MAQRKAISWILNFTNDLPNDVERIKCLQANDGPAIRSILKYALDPSVEWLLPEGDPPFEINGEDFSELKFYSEARKLYLFVAGGNDNIHPIKRERLFIDFLSSIYEEDAKMVLAAKNKTLPWKNITKKLVKKAFPGLIDG